MEAVFMPIPKKVSLECSCQTGNLKSSRNRIFAVCDICSEKKFLRKTSSGSLVSSDSSSFADEN